MCGENTMTDQQSQQIERLYFDLFAQMTAYANSVLKNRALAEEAVQETFRVACMKPEALCASPNPKGWLLLTLKNVLNNTVRRMVSTSRLTEKIKITYEPASSDPTDLRLLYGPLADREEFRLIRSVSEGKTILELAQELDISVEACKKRVQRARAYLKKRI